MKLLIAEDEEVVRRALTDLLVDDFDEILLAADGAEALELARAEQPDLILLDVAMPGMGGMETCAQLMALPASREIPIVVLTALADEAQARAAFALGAVDYLTKPFNPLQLRARLRTLLLTHVTSPASQPPTSREDAAASTDTGTGG